MRTSSNGERNINEIMEFRRNQAAHDDERAHNVNKRQSQYTLRQIYIRTNRVSVCLCVECLTWFACDLNLKKYLSHFDKSFGCWLLTLISFSENSSTFPLLCWRTTATIDSNSVYLHLANVIRLVIASHTIGAAITIFGAWGHHLLEIRTQIFAFHTFQLKSLTLIKSKTIWATGTCVDRHQIVLRFFRVTWWLNVLFVVTQVPTATIEHNHFVT